MFLYISQWKLHPEITTPRSRRDEGLQTPRTIAPCTSSPPPQPPDSHTSDSFAMRSWRQHREDAAWAWNPSLEEEPPSGQQEILVHPPLESIISYFSMLLVGSYFTSERRRTSNGIGPWETSVSSIFLCEIEIRMLPPKFLGENYDRAHVSFSFNVVFLPLSVYDS